MLTMDELVASNVESTAHWRRLKAFEYPDDLRNEKAAEKLDQIAIELKAFEGTDTHRKLAEFWESLSEDDASQFSFEINEMTKGVGFRNHYDNAEDFVDNLIDRVTVTIQSIRDDQIEHRRHGLSQEALNEIKSVVLQIERKLDSLGASNSSKAEMHADIVILLAEVSRPEPKKTFLQGSLESLRDNLAQSTGAAVAGFIAALTLILAKHFGVM